MKRLLGIAILCAMISLTACGTDTPSVADSSVQGTSATEQKSTSESKVEVEATTDNGSVEVDEGLLTVEVTIPASMIDDLEETKKKAEENEAVLDYKVNDDGSITYKYKKSDYNKLIADMRTGFDTMVADQLASGDYTTLSTITGDETLRNVTITVTNQQDYDKTWDGLVIIGLYVYTGYYQIFSGEAKEESDVKTTFHFVDGSTGSEFKTTVYPDALQSQ